MSDLGGPHEVGAPNFSGNPGSATESCINTVYINIFNIYIFNILTIIINNETGLKALPH